jgi:two-component system, NarL family, nitrate/nitrite response regulator NarL
VPYTLSETLPDCPIRVFLLLQSRLLRDALDRLFRKRGDFLVVGCCGPEECSAQQLSDAQCHVLAADFFDAKWLPATLQRGAGNSFGLKLLLLGMSDDPREFLAAVRGGVIGYLSKEASTSDVVAAVRSTFRGEAVCPPKLCSILFEYVAQTATSGLIASHGVRPALTLRQQQLVALVAKGLTNKEIAMRLNISEYTVRNHLHRILKQVDARSRSQAVETIRSHGYELVT